MHNDINISGEHFELHWNEQLQFVFHLIAMRCRQLCCGCVLFVLEVARTKTTVAFQSRLDNLTTLPHTHTFTDTVLCEVIVTVRPPAFSLQPESCWITLWDSVFYMHTLCDHLGLMLNLHVCPFEHAVTVSRHHSKIAVNKYHRRDALLTHSNRGKHTHTSTTSCCQHVQPLNGHLEHL